MCSAYGSVQMDCKKCSEELAEIQRNAFNNPKRLPYGGAKSIDNVKQVLGSHRTRVDGEESQSCVVSITTATAKQ